jgi:ribonuclease III
MKDNNIRLESFRRLEQKLRYKFLNIELLKEALTHSSFVNEHPEFNKDNQRLEFLGDAILNLIASLIVMEAFPKVREGTLSKMRATIVNESVLAKIARELGLGEAIFLGKGEEASQGRNKDSILADSYEALIAAIYLDRGFKQAFKVVSSHLKSKLELSKSKIIDYKSVLQEKVQAKFKVLPSYSIIDETGPDHAKIFKVKVMIKGKEYGRAKGKSKKGAEQNAAKKALSTIEKL